ncbi:MAG: ABC transporter permease [Thermoguttaceae bacterium]|nr:ABC transporter permease [Thermoguttaceae bacterium]
MKQKRGTDRSGAFRLNELLLTLPSLLMLIVLVGIPTIIVVFNAFCADSRGGWGEGFSLAAFREIFTVYYAGITLETILYTALTSFFSILIGLPVAYTIARSRGRMRLLLLLLVFIPFWTNMVVHIAAWKIVLHPDGFLRNVLVFMNLIDEKQLLWNTPFAVLTLFVYVFLPFAIIPLYASIEKFDFRLIESARDLGATASQAFFRVFLPGIRNGIYSAAMLVFVPVFGCYIIPQLVGGPGCDVLYANKIYQFTSTQSRNIPIAAALSLFLLLAMLVPWIIYRIHLIRQANSEGNSRVVPEPGNAAEIHSAAVSCQNGTKLDTGAESLKNAAGFSPASDMTEKEGNS